MLPEMTKPPTPPIVRMAHSLAFAAFLRHIGTGPERFLENARLPVASDDSNAFVPLVQVWKFFDLAAHSIEHSLAWHVGRFTGEHHLNRPLLDKLRHAPSLYVALERFVQLVHSETSHIQLRLNERKTDVLLSTCYPGMIDTPGYHCAQAYQLGVITTIVRHHAGRDWFPDEIGIEAPNVPRDVSLLYPGSCIRVRRDFGYITIPRSILHLPPPEKIAPDFVPDDRLTLADEFSYEETLGALLKPHLSEGYPNADLAAALMDTSLRTLARRLSAEGVSYRNVVDNLRFTEARKLLENPDTRIKDAAAAVGFEDPSHFTRMFRRIGGISPRDFQNSLE